MTPRERVQSIYKGETPDKIPFGIWSNKLPSGDLGKQILAQETCVFVKTSVYTMECPGVQVEVTGEDTAECPIRLTTYKTPAGDLATRERFFANSWWMEDRLFKNSGDYDALEALIASRVYLPTYDAYMKADTAFGGQSVARAATIYSPVMEIICLLMGVETFCMEWMDNRDRMLHLVEVLAEDRRRRVEITAESPCEYAVIEGNLIPNVIGTDIFERYCIPYIEESCDMLHSAGKLAAAHLDGDNNLFAPLIAHTSLDLIESFTPPPDCDMSVAEAREIWPDKSLLINFPSSVHLGGPEAVRAIAEQIIREASPGDRTIISVCEDIPEGGKHTLLSLAEVVNQIGSIPLVSR